MATRKPDSEVGPLGVWAYNTRNLLGLSDVQVAEAAGVTKPTIRKIEGGSNKAPSQRVLIEMYKLFRGAGEEQDLPVEPPPGLHRPYDSATYGDTRTVAESPLMAAAIDRQTDAIREQTAMLRAVLEAIAGVTPPGVPPLSPGQSTRLRELASGIGEPPRTSPQERQGQEVKG